MKRFLRQLLAFFCFLAAAGSGVASLVPNGGFEEGFANWRPFWARDPGAGTATLDSETVHGGKNSVRIECRGEKDWNLETQGRLKVAPGDVFELSAWMKRGPGVGHTKLCVTTYDAGGKPCDYAYGAQTVKGETGWQFVRTKFMVPPGIAEIQPRFTGHGPATAWVDDFSLERKPGVDLSRKAGLPGAIVVRNATLSVTLDTATAALAVEDLRTGQKFCQASLSAGMVVTEAQAADRGIVFSLIHAPSCLEMKASVQLEGDAPEFTCDLAAQGELPAAVKFPAPFATQPGQRLIIPMNEGIAYPVEDASIDPFRLIAYGGHGICMAFWGVTDGERGHMAIIQTPDDAAIHIGRSEGRLVVAPEWEPQQGRFGPTRSLRYVFFDKGGYVAMAKRYRTYAQKIGLFKTLAQKCRENPNVDRLVGAVNVWNWEKDAVGMVKEMQAAGIERILWSNAAPPETLKALNGLGVLTSRYDIYQDVMDPAKFPELRGVNAEWTTAGWPKDLNLNAKGEWIHGWEIETKAGGMYPCGVLCDLRAPDYARERIPAELAKSPYRCRFIDTTTATSWRECYNPAHPMTRTDSRKAKMELLRYISQDCKLVEGSETGHDAAVPFLHYFEGMLSLGPYRVPDSGRHTQRIWDEVPERVAKFQLGHTYRLPLWELVYHDCVVAHWYWGDYSNKLPSLWDKRDLFNVLYGTVPMFMFSRDFWREHQARFVQSYRNTAPYARQVGYCEMTDHRSLTPDRSVQQTAFANGMTVTVNFGDAPYQIPGGEAVPPMGFRVGWSSK